MKTLSTTWGHSPRFTVAGGGLLLFLTALFGATNVGAQAPQEYGTLDPYTPLDPAAGSSCNGTPYNAYFDMGDTTGTFCNVVEGDGIIDNPVIDQGQVDFFLGFVVPVDRPLAEFGDADDIIDAAVLKPFFNQHLQCCFQNLISTLYFFRICHKTNRLVGLF